MKRDLARLTFLLNELRDQRDDTARLLLSRSSSLALANVRALKAKHASLTRRIERLEGKLK